MEGRDGRSEKVKITLSCLMFSAAYNLQKVRYRHTHVPDGELPRDNGSGYARGGGNISKFWILVSLIRYLLRIPLVLVYIR